jgi:chromosome segregation ATPase
MLYGKDAAPTSHVYEETAMLMLQACAHKQQLSDELSQLTGKHKQLQADKEAADTELSTLKPAHAELQQMHEKAKTELQNTKTALQKSQEARVHAEVRTATVTNHKC